MVALVCGLFEIVKSNPFAGEKFFETIGLLYTNGISLKGGGVFSAVIGWPLYAACGKTGAIIIISLFLFAFIMLLTGATLIGLFKGVYKPVKKMEETYALKREEIENRNKNKFDINVDLGPDSDSTQQTTPTKKPSLEELLGIEKEEKKNQKELSKEALNAESKIKASSEQLDELIKRAVDDQPIKPTITQSPPKDEKIDIIPPIIDDSNQTKLYADSNNTTKQYVTPPISLLKAPKFIGNQDVSEELKANAH